ncbi:MAG: peptidylprolyl isomerase [Candidatus Lambdaproteobacteria bacterium]|nr:peptidylprolyl isomerase [Candidatus Lambdaproteobacteria bacterium]
MSPAAPAAPTADPVVARINGRELRLSAVYAVIEALPLGEQIELREGIERFAESLITEEMLFQGALANDFADVLGLRDEVKSLVTQRLIETRIRARIQVSAEEVAAFHRANRDLVEGRHVRISHILRGRREECERLLAQIHSAQDFARLVAAQSLDGASVPRGGDLGYVMAEPGALGFEPELFKLGVGELGVFESSRGCHVVRVTEIQAPDPPSPAQVQALVRPYLERLQEQALLRDYLRELEGRVRVERHFDKLR